MMDVSAFRRKKVTYGKANKRLPVSNIYDSDVSDHHVRTDEMSTEDVERKAQGDTQMDLGRPLLLSPETRSSCEASDAPRTPRSSNDEDNCSSVFEIASSDEELNRRDAASPNLKRRKLTPVRTLKRQTQFENHHPAVAAAACEGYRLGSEDQSSGTEQDIQCPPGSRRVARPVDRNVLKSSKLDGRKQSHLSQVASATITKRGNSTDSSLSRSRGALQSSNFPDQSNDTKIRKPTTPKPVALLPSIQFDGVPVESPSQLRLKMLSLSPQRPFTAESSSSPVDDFPPKTDGQFTPKGRRGRLVDMLDSPSQRSRASSARSDNPEGDGVPDVDENKMNLDRRLPSASMEKETHLREKISFAPASKQPLLVRSKVTYAKERSHLSDIVLDDKSISTSQNSDSKDISQESTQSSLDIHLLQDHDDDGDAAREAVAQSIHELRQSGNNDRFLSDLNDLFEDVESRSTSSKARRLQGLIHLLQNFKKVGYIRQFVDLGMTDRLASCAKAEPDKLTAVLLTLAYGSIASEDNLRLYTLQRILAAVAVSASPILSEKRAILKIAKDRDENLSKAMIRDLSDFEDSLRAASSTGGDGTHALTPQAIALRSVETVFRALRDAKDFETEVPASLVKALLTTLEQCCQEQDDGKATPDSANTIEMIMSVLEYAYLNPESTLRGGADDVDIQVIGNMIQRVDRGENDMSSPLELLTLRVLVSLTNNNKAVCDTLASTTAIQGLLSVVEGSFQTLAERADLGSHLEESKLDAVLLALGCLINFAEYSPRSCQVLLDDDSKKDAHGGLRSLVASFNDRIGRAAEARSLAQSRVLVAFGFLSMLICTLCLDEDVKRIVTALLVGQSLQPLFLAVDTFLQHFHTVEEDAVDDEASTNFTARFENILAIVSSRGLPAS